MSADQAALEQRVVRRSRLSAWLGLAGFVLIAFAVGYSALRLNELRHVERELDQRQADLQNSRAELQKTRGEIAAAAAELESVKRSIRDQADVLGRVGMQLAANDLAAARRAIAEQAPATPAVRRLYIQIRTEHQHLQYERCADAFRALRFRVPPPQLIADRGPARTEVRYFHDGDDELAAAVRREMERCTSGQVELKRVRGFESSPLVPSGQLEVWLSPTVR